MVELGGLRVEASDGIAQTVAVGELRERHTAKLVLAAETLHPAIAAEPLDTTAQRVQRQVVHQLRENDLALVHRSAPSRLRESRNLAARIRHVQVDDSPESRTIAANSIAPAIAPSTDSGHYWDKPRYDRGMQMSASHQ